MTIRPCPIVRPFIRTPYNYDRDLASAESGLQCLDPTLTQQQYKDEVDINTIARNFGITGQLPVNVRMPSYGDFSDVHDFQSAMNAVRRANESFMQMQPEVRERFANDPQRFVAFCSDPANRDEAVKLGLAYPPKPVPSDVPANPEPPKPM